MFSNEKMERIAQINRIDHIEQETLNVPNLTSPPAMSTQHIISKDGSQKSNSSLRMSALRS